MKRKQLTPLRKKGSRKETPACGARPREYTAPNRTGSSAPVLTINSQSAPSIGDTATHAVSLADLPLQSYPPK